MSGALSGPHGRLEPLRPEHADELWPASSPGIWRYMPNPPPATARHLEQWITWRLAARGPHDEVYLVRDADGMAAGSTSLFDHDPGNKRAEIGWTWYGAPWHGTLLNKQIKLLLLQQAFGPMGLNRVQMKCDARNQRSVHAITALGATHEGTLRQHDVLWDGFVRDVEMFSVTRDEWPEVQAALEARITLAGRSKPAGAPRRDL